jgi:hypothetical protein
MPRKTTGVKRFFAWSFSRLSNYRRCPAQAKYKHISRLPTQQGPALARGAEVHEFLQKVATAAARDIPKRREFSWAIKKIRSAIKGKEFDVERRWAVNKTWNKVEWFDPNAWCRIVADLVVYETSRTWLIVDHKTGKLREEEVVEQLSLYATIALQLEPKLKVVKVQAWYSDLEKSVERVFRRSDLEDLTIYWNNETGKMLADTRFAPRPGNYCTWCDFSKKKGGPCRY